MIRKKYFIKWQNTLLIDTITGKPKKRVNLAFLEAYWLYHSESNISGQIVKKVNTNNFQNNSNFSLFKTYFYFNELWSFKLQDKRTVLV